MQRLALFFASLLVLFFVAAVPSLAQTVTVAQAFPPMPDADAEAVEGSDALGIQQGFPELRKPLPQIIYPVRAEKFQIEGRVYVEYTVNKRGQARDVQILSGPGYGCEEEVLRVLRAARFQPHMDDAGETVSTRFRSAFDFMLQ